MHIWCLREVRGLKETPPWRPAGYYVPYPQAGWSCKSNLSLVGIGKVCGMRTCGRTDSVLTLIFLVMRGFVYSSPEVAMDGLFYCFIKLDVHLQQIAHFPNL